MAPDGTASWPNMGSLESAHRKERTDIIQRHARLHIQTHFIRMDFVTPGKWLLHFHGPSDLIFRAFHYFALIKCGKGDAQRGRQSKCYFCGASFGKPSYQTGLERVQEKTTLFFVHKHTRLAVF